MTARKRILVICPYPQGVAAGQRLKYEQYLDDWRAHGFEVTVSSFMDHRLWQVVYEPGHLRSKVIGVLLGQLRRIWDLFRIWRYDIIYIHMNVTPFGSTLFERLTRLMAGKLVYDVEDNVLSGPEGPDDSNPNPILRWLKGPAKPRYLIDAADHVICASVLMRDLYQDLRGGRDVSAIPSSVDTDRFLPATTYRNDQTLTIGWTGTFSSRPYLDLLAPAFQALAQRRAFRLIVIGNFDYDLPGVDLEVLRWSADQEVAQLQRLDIGVYPLPDDEWVKGKAGLKVIQYMAFGLPSVSSPVGVTPMVVRDGETGLLANTTEEWIAALERLIDDSDLRRRIGQAARSEAVARYSRHAVASQYRRVLGGLVSGGSFRQQKEE